MMHSFTTQLTTAFTALRSRAVYYACGLDALFFMLYIIVTALYQAKIFELLQGAIAQTLQPSGATTFFQVFFNEATAPFFIRILILVIALFASVYLLFCAYVSISTYISFNLPNLSNIKTKPLWAFVKKFFRIMVPWACIFAALEIIGFYYAYLDTARQTLGIDNTYFPIVNTLLISIIVYVMFISALLPVKKNFRSSWKYACTNLKLLPAFGVTLVGYVVLSIISMWLLRIPSGVFWLLIVVLPVTLLFFIYVRKLFSLAYHQ